MHPQPASKSALLPAECMTDELANSLPAGRSLLIKENTLISLKCLTVKRLQMKKGSCWSIQAVHLLMKSDALWKILRQKMRSPPTCPWHRPARWTFRQRMPSTCCSPVRCECARVPVGIKGTTRWGEGQRERVRERREMGEGRDSEGWSWCCQLVHTVIKLLLHHVPSRVAVYFWVSSFSV